MTPVPNFNKWCAVSNFLFKNIDFCIFTPKTPLVKENYFLTLWNFTYLKDTSFGKKLCNFELGLETKNEFEKWPLYNIVSVYMGIHFFSIKALNVDCWYLLEPPLAINVLSKNSKSIKIFLMIFLLLFVVTAKNVCTLHGNVFVMCIDLCL